MGRLSSETRPILLFVGNLYASLLTLKRQLIVDDTVDDQRLLDYLEVASRALDRVTGRRFYSQVATRVFDGPGGTRLWLPSWDGDLISVTSLAVDEGDDGIYELALTTSDYRLWPYNADGEPYRRIDIRGNSVLISAWPSGPAAVQVVGRFGWSEVFDALTTANGSAITGTVADASTPTITTSADATTRITAGETIKIESEHLYVSAVSSTALTVTRGVNGTTAAAHSAKAISRRRYPVEVEQAVVMVTSRYLRDMRTAGSGSIGGGDFGASLPTEYAQIAQLQRFFTAPVVA
ncbi:MAG: phage gp6-like head-tail connector protein [SAR202 cluster bacterium]|nr:phage gp6-like head-tail connector protein [SAR202 cluster bacterium]